LNTTLLLNSSFEPIRIISWEKAITLYFLGKVEVIENYERKIRSVSLVMRVPSVVRLLRFVRFRACKPSLNKLNLLVRDSFSCQYCFIPLSREQSTIDHVVPKSKGGGTIWENVVIACTPCNRKKGSKTPNEAKMSLKTKPKAPSWLPVSYIDTNRNAPLIWRLFIKSGKKHK